MKKKRSSNGLEAFNWVMPFAILWGIIVLLILANSFYQTREAKIQEYDKLTYTKEEFCTDKGGIYDYGIINHGLYATKNETCDVLQEEGTYKQYIVKGNEFKGYRLTQEIR